MIVNEKRVNQQIRNFEKALNGYSYTEPLARYLTRFFKENKQMGSSDRRMTSRFCYNYFRLGNSLKSLTTIDRLVIAEYLCENQSDVVTIFNAGLSETITEDLDSKIRNLSQLYDFKLIDVFPFSESLSDGIDSNDFFKSHFIQPDLFIRIKKGEESLVKDTLAKNEFDYVEVALNTLSLSNGAKLQSLSGVLGKYEVQDLSSQYTLSFMTNDVNASWWDACAASGGKSLMLLDRYPKIDLMVSDVRLSILRNLDERFEQAKVSRNYRKKVLDLTQDLTTILGDEKFDGILLDVPCSGSGTWGRTPEMIQQFDETKLREFSVLQKAICSNVIPYIKQGKPLVYMTCSVYKEENEEVVNYLAKEFGLEIERMELIKGYNKKADSMFAARLIKL